MKVLLDENLPHDLRHLIKGHDVSTVSFNGWCGIENGELLRAAAEAGFDVMLTRDSGVEYQQNLEELKLSVISIRSRTNKLEDIAPLVPDIRDALASLRPRQFVKVG